MDILIDDPAIEQQFREILALIRLRKNGETSAQMKKMGLEYKLNWGVSLMHLKEIAARYEPNHLLALKLWNKKWREAMILASLLDVPDEVTEEQMDYWTKSLENTELAEMLSANLWVKTKFAYAKSLEWIVGKKYLVHYTGLHLMGRLAMTDKKAIDEMFEPYFEVLTPLAKDPQLKHVFYRSFLLIARRSENLHRQCTAFAESLGRSESESARELGRMILEELAAR